MIDSLKKLLIYGLFSRLTPIFKRSLFKSERNRQITLPARTIHKQKSEATIIKHAYRSIPKGFSNMQASNPENSLPKIHFPIRLGIWRSRLRAIASCTDSYKVFHRSPIIAFPKTSNGTSKFERAISAFLRGDSIFLGGGGSEGICKDIQATRYFYKVAFTRQ